MIPVIICGGFGTKLWPISREHKPKHFLPLIGSKSLFQLNYEALRTHFKAEEIYISTNVDQAELAKKQVPEIVESNFILEPEMRNQGPATGNIAAFLYKKGLADEPFMVVQADVLREPTDSFIKMMLDCDGLAKKETKYITGGFKPDSAIAGVDYLIEGDRVSGENETGIYKVAKFVWRGSNDENEKVVGQGNALVHANHTCMTPRNLLNMFQKYRPEWYEPLFNIAKGEDLATEYAKLEPGPIEDVTEKVHQAGESLVVELPFKWFDFGTFESLYKYLKENNLYQVTQNIVEVESKGNFVRLDDPNKVVALVGVENLVVVDTGDALLICPDNQTSKVGDARKEVEKRKLELT